MSGHEFFSSIHDRRAADHCSADDGLFGNHRTSPDDIALDLEELNQIPVMKQSSDAFERDASQRLQREMRIAPSEATRETTMGTFLVTGHLPGDTPRGWGWGELVGPDTLKSDSTGAMDYSSETDQDFYEQGVLRLRDAIGLRSLLLGDPPSEVPREAAEDHLRLVPVANNSSSNTLPQQEGEQ